MGEGGLQARELSGVESRVLAAMDESSKNASCGGISVRAR